jgi:RsiW-degrading membrane proteinase PrsW (M82 family)
MNRKQIISMWCGIAVFVYYGFNLYYYGIEEVIVRWICICVVTAGLIYTFRNNKPKKDKQEESK